MRLRILNQIKDTQLIAKTDEANNQEKICPIYWKKIDNYIQNIVKYILNDWVRVNEIVSLSKI